MSQDKKKTKPAKAKVETEVREVPDNDEIVQKQVLAESEVQADAQKDQEPQRETAIETVPEVGREPEPEKVSDQKTTCLKSVRAWMKAQRLASWQSAALLRAKGWTDDKQVTEAEFNQALKAVLSRPQGGSQRGGKR